MRRLRLKPAAVARLTVLGGGLVAVVGVALMWGLAIALMGGGAAAVAYGLLLIDVDRR